jgi:hypothetical protein
VWPRLVPLSEASDCDVDDDVDAARLRIKSSSRRQNAAWNWAKLSTTTHRGARGSIPNPRSAPKRPDKKISRRRHTAGSEADRVSREIYTTATTTTLFFAATTHFEAGK